MASVASAPASTAERSVVMGRAQRRARHDRAMRVLLEVATQVLADGVLHRALDVAPAFRRWRRWILLARRGGIPGTPNVPVVHLGRPPRAPRRPQAERQNTTRCEAFSSRPASSSLGAANGLGMPSH